VRLFIILISSSLLANSGCKFNEEPSCVAFNETSITVYGVTEGKKQQFQLPLTVKKDVIVQSCDASCVCAKIDKSVIGTMLRTGQEHYISMEIDPFEKSEVLFSVLLVTEDGSTAITSIGGIVTRFPRAVPNSISANFVRGAPPPEGEIVIESKIGASHLLTNPDDMRKNQSARTLVGQGSIQGVRCQACG